MQFQLRDFILRDELAAGERHVLHYMLRPVERGEYAFNDINIFVTTPLHLVVRRYKIEAARKIKV